MKAHEIAKVFERIAPIDSGIPDDELGFIWGNPEIEVHGVGCMWCIHTGSIQYCIDHDINMAICHEELGLQAQTSPWYKGPDATHIHSNSVRRRLLEQHGITVYRSHSNWDALPVDGIADSAVTALGITNLKEVGRQKFFSVHELDTVMSASQLMELAASKLGYEGCRLFGDGGKVVRRFAFLIGGFGENQLHMPQSAMEMGAEALVIGEMSEFIVMSCLEMGLPVIETLHSVSEIPGIKRQALVLARHLPHVRIEYVPSGSLSFGTHRTWTG
jgi:putative NIF3 family GTP cyclohydrolase 1 type 2